ncbi:DGQHR domain-containing protein [Ralstonia sp. 24A2]|uniref:DGQHR domain-containing protein n=1 Tax=Ralstonia sp. 24A2 TaxID=3447364 RepID=UPI003F6A433A
MTEAPISLELSCLKLKQPLGEFFICKISAKDLCEITYFDIREMLKEREIDEYIGIQRKVDKNRVKELRQYVNSIDACFPTSIVLAIDDGLAVYDEERGKLTLSNRPNPDEGEEAVFYRGIAKVIDGQHRIEGLRGLESGDFELTLSIFVGLDVEDQAYIFSTVNLAQTKVNKSLVYDLFDFAKSRSPQRTCHNIATALDRRDHSPFEKKIKRLGSATEGRVGETLTQATFVEALLPYISAEPSVDRDNIKRKIPLKKADAESSRKLIFRNLFVEERDLDIALILFNYFCAVRNKWPQSWESLGKGNILNKTNGFRALMRFMRVAYLSFNQRGVVPTVEMFDRIFARIDLADGSFTVEEYKPGTSGESELYKALISASNL